MKGSWDLGQEERGEGKGEMEIGTLDVGRWDAGYSLLRTGPALASFNP